MTNWLEYHEEPVTLHSGGRSHWLVRGDLIFADEHLREAVLDFWVGCLRPLGAGRKTCILGVPRGGLQWARGLAYRIGEYVGPDDDVSAYEQVVVIDDVVTTGNSIESFRLDIAVRVSCAVVQRGGRLVGAAWARMNLPMVEEVKRDG